MKNVFLRTSLFALVFFVMTVSTSQADSYTRYIHYYVEIYAYQGPNGEAGPYYCGSYFKETKKVLASHADDQPHLGDGFVFLEEWWSSCQGSGYHEIPDDIWDRHFLETNSSTKPEEDTEVESLATSWKFLRDEYESSQDSGKHNHDHSKECPWS